jgi:hypothetical protein
LLTRDEARRIAVYFAPSGLKDNLARKTFRSPVEVHFTL